MLALLIAATLSTAAGAAPPLLPQPMVYTPAPETAVPVPDPARLAVATRIAARLLPDGSYRSMMDGLLASMQQGMFASMTILPVRDMAKAAGVPEARVAALPPATVRDVMAILDPSFAERIRLTTAAMTHALLDTMAGMEPAMREGLAIAYANRFTAAELADIDAFFGSPTGRVYAAANLQLVNDPAVRSRTQGMTKAMMAQMPALMAKAVEATKNLPKPRTYADLTVADRAKLAALLGVAPGALK